MLVATTVLIKWSSGWNTDANVTAVPTDLQTIVNALKKNCRDSISLMTSSSQDGSLLSIQCVTATRFTERICNPAACTRCALFCPIGCSSTKMNVHRSEEFSLKFWRFTIYFLPIEFLEIIPRISHYGETLSATWHRQCSSNYGVKEKALTDGVNSLSHHRLRDAT